MITEFSCLIAGQTCGRYKKYRPPLCSVSNLIADLQDASGDRRCQFFWATQAGNASQPDDASRPTDYHRHYSREIATGAT
jgi:hypothetical protein